MNQISVSFEVIISVINYRYKLTRFISLINAITLFTIYRVQALNLTIYLGGIKEMHEYATKNEVKSNKAAN